MAEKTSRKKNVLKGIGLLLVVAGGYLGWRFGPTVADFWKAGFFESALSPRELRTYQGTSVENLMAMHLALSLYHESEGQFPHSAGWMDALEPYLRTDDMKKEEAIKKLVHPLLRPPKQGVFGYAMNDAASEQYKEDIPNPDETPLIFDSSDTSWNAHGKPEELLPKPPRPGGNRGISIGGNILEL
jgi:hypothetical protein